MKKILLGLIAVLFLIWNLGSTSPIDTKAAWQDLVAREGAQWRPHFSKAQTLHSLYGLSKTHSGSSKEAASQFLQNYYSMFGVDRLGDMRLESVEESAIGTHYTYRQYYGGYRVVGGELAIHVNHSNQVIGATSGCAAGLSGRLQFAPFEDAARATAARYLGNMADVSRGELWVLPMGTQARLVWRVQAYSTQLSKGSYLMYVDAANPNLVLRVHKTFATFDGSASIYAQNPVVTSSKSKQTLPDMDGSKKISGKFAVLHDANFQKDVGGVIKLSDYTTASDPGRQYNYADDDPRFAEAMGYFHINVVHARWNQVGFNKLNKKAPIFVNVLESDGGIGFDNAFYSRDPKFATGIFVFGAGHDLENLGQDCDVYYHEYGHGVLDHTKPGLFEALESNYAGAFHEAFGDISDVAITLNSKVGEFGLRLKGSKRFIGRDVNNTRRFPQDVALPPTRKSEVHYTGEIIGGMFWDLQEAIGAETGEEAVFNALPLMPNEMNFFDLRDAMITADQNRQGGIHVTAINDAFSKHGLGGTDPGQPGTVTVNALKAGLLNPNTGAVTLKSTFKQGDTIVIVEGYKGTGLTPGYNLVPVDANLAHPPGPQPDAFLLLDEAVNGANNGKNGAAQAVIFTDENTVKGQYTVDITSQLGGTDKVFAKKTVKFKVN